MGSKQAAKTLEVKGHSVTCPLCSHPYFWTRQTLMNTRLATLMELDWTERVATNYICDNCGYVFWFLEK